MSTGMAIRTIIEFAFIVLFIYGLLNEQKIIEFEDKAVDKLCLFIIRTRRKWGLMK